MEETEELPIVVDGRTVARAIIERDREQAIESAKAAASHVSTPDDIQFCTFSDGSHSNDARNLGGVALAYMYKWLPQGWAAEKEATRPSGDTDMDENAWPFVQAGMVAKAWAFGHAVGAPVMEVVGVLESLFAANEDLERYLPLLTEHASTVMVKATTDCQEVLHYISKATPTATQAKTLPPRLIKEMHDLILALQDHGIKVIVELHWCPRNMVPQLLAADALAGGAMRRGLGYCNVTKNSWSEATQSVIMRELEPMLLGVVRFARLAVSHTSNGPGSTGTIEEEPTKKRRREKKKAAGITEEVPTKRRRRETKKARRAQAAAEASTGAANSRPQLPLPTIPLPPKPVTTSNAAHTTSNAGLSTFNAEPTTIPFTKQMASGAAEADTTAAANPHSQCSSPDTAVPSKLATTSNAETTTTSAEQAPPPTTPSTKPMASAAADAQLPEKPIEAEAVKRKVDEDMEESEEMPNKKSKLSPDLKRQEKQQHPLTMPASWAVDVYLSDTEGEITGKPAPSIRRNPRSTQETGEINVFINDGVRLFSLAIPIGIVIQD